jgi:predicted dehydrogenase
MKPVKLAIIGTGIAAKELHLPALMKLKDKYEIVAVCNHTEQKAREFSRLVNNVPFTLNYRDILSSSAVEAVDIALPIHLNFRVVKDALEAGKHVIVEKPIAGNLFDAELMTTFPDRYDSVMMVAENFRYNPVFIRARQIIASGEIGKPYAMFWNNFLEMSTGNKYAGTLWRIEHQYPGGFITDGGVHIIAAIRMLFGEIVYGIGQSRSVNPAIGKVDSFTFQFKTDRDVTGIYNSYYSVKGHNENRLTVLGTIATMIIEGTKLSLYNGRSEPKVEIFDTDGGYTEEFEDFYNAIRKGNSPVSSFQEGYLDFKTIVTALKSANKWDGLDLFRA